VRTEIRICPQTNGGGNNSRNFLQGHTKRGYTGLQDGWVDLMRLSPNAATIRNRKEFRGTTRGAKTLGILSARVGSEPVGIKANSLRGSQRGLRLDR